LTVGVVRLGADGFIRWADESSGAFDTTTAEGITRPTTSTVSSGAGSLVRWQDLGYEGRSFVAGAARPGQPDSSCGGGADTAPIRAYVGLTSADTVEQRVRLAVAELRRMGAFDRRVLVVVTPTGTGWVDPDAARAIECLYGGDTAMVAVQYSFLPSWIAFLLDGKSPPILGRALFDAVHDEWVAHPAGTRPRLVVFGESLGSFGAESAFSRADLAGSIEAMTSQVGGALFTGPTGNNPVFEQIVSGRVDDSPPWRPTLIGEPHLRVANRAADIAPGQPGWPTPRVLYVHHPSDAVGTWKVESIWRAPGWAQDPAAYDIPSAATWVPLVSFVQESFDLLNGFSANPGHGHDYSTDFVAAWAAVAPPAGWTPADTARLAAHLDRRP
ncbi:MAG TPA: alpha/beta-hydrolase family protein, partial [Candidatus Lustribacter sp.]|nr:alpha/beta-hydrolase family protein [Candidatus Lustribacter sp.]